jgi:hypothetical protein
LAEELGASVDGPAPAPAPAPPRPRAWEEPLKAARAALRAGRPTEAQRLVRAAEQHAGADGDRSVRAVADEIAAVLTAAADRWRAAAAAREARRWSEAVDQLERLRQTAVDVPGPRGEAVDDLLQEARAALERADRAVAAALSGPAADRASALSAVLADCPGHPGATAALAQIPVAAPAWVSAARDARGDVLVLWAASATPDVVYRVSRQGSDGRWQVLGRTGTTSLDDGGAPVGVEVPVYAVVAMHAGRASDEARSDTVAAVAAVAPSVSGPPVGPEPPRDVHAVRVAGGAVRVSWTGSAEVEYRVRGLTPDGRWRVVGRTRALAIEDGGAPAAGPVPVYAVSAAADGERSAEIHSNE